MKQRLLSLFLALFCITAGAQADVVINKQNFPDDNFRDWLLWIDYDKDEKFSDEEIANITGMRIDGMEIETLQGIEYFTALKDLFCSENQLKTLDLSKNTALQFLYCYNNQLTTLDVSNCTVLVSLYCSNNQLESLDLSNNTALGWLDCTNNQLTKLKLSTALEDVSCSNNRLESLDDVSNCLSLQILNCSGNQLTSLVVSNNTALIFLDCSGNQLTTLNVSNNTALTFLGCGGNQLTSLDVSKNTALTYVGCPYNQLTTLDVSKNKSLRRLACMGNAISGEGMTTLVNSLPTIPAGEEEEAWMEVCYENTFDVGADPDGNKMTTAQAKVATDKGWKLYKWINSVERVDYAGESSGEDGDIAIDATNFPDENFRNWLLAQDYGADGKLTAEEIAGVTKINMYNKEIEDLTGIAYFTNLIRLDCYWNLLANLDLSKNTALEYLNCSLNPLFTLDLSNNTALTYLDCSYNQLTTLDVTNNTALETLYCNANQLTVLDVSKNTALYFFDCSYNKLTTLNVSNNTALKGLHCYDNQLTTLDLSKNTLLYILVCCQNAISGAGMTALVNSLPTIPAGDYGNFVVYDESGGTSEHNRITTAQVKVATDKGWMVFNFNYEDYAGEPEVNGDANGDGEVNIADVVMLSKAILTGSTDLKYDVNGDGQVNAKDIPALVTAIAGY